MYPNRIADVLVNSTFTEKGGWTPEQEIEIEKVQALTDLAEAVRSLAINIRQGETSDKLNEIALNINEALGHLTEALNKQTGEG